MSRIIPRDKFIIILFFVAILSGLLWGSKVWGQPPTFGGDGPIYNSIAKNILEHHRFASDKSDFANISEPFYPVFLSGVYLFFGKDNFDAVRIIQILLFALTVLIIYLLANLACRQTGEIAGNRVAKIASLFVALFFPLAACACEFMRENLFTFLIVFAIYSLYKAQGTFPPKADQPRAGKTRWFIFSGIFLGLATLTNAIVQFFIIFAVFGFLLIFRKDFFRRDILLKIGAFALFFILIIGIWSFGDFGQGPKSLNSKAGTVLGRKAEMIENIRGEVYLRHLGGQFLGYYFFEKNGFNPAVLLSAPKTIKGLRVMLARGESLEQVNKKFSEESLPVIIGNLPRYFAISFLDFLQFNGPMLPNPETLEAAPMQNLFIKNSHPELPAILKIIILFGLRIVYWLFFGFVIYGLVRAVKNWKKPASPAGGFIWLILIVLYFNLAYSAAFGIPRYSIPIYPFYITLFAYGASAFWGRLNLEKISKKINFNVA